MIVDFDRSYVPDVLNLFRLSFNREYDPADWSWRYLENPFYDPIIKLMFDGSVLVGYYAVSLTPLYVFGNVHKVALSVDTMTHPEYRRRGIFVKLAEECYSTCVENGVVAVYGFPNQNSADGFFTKLQWQKGKPVREYVLNCDYSELSVSSELVVQSSFSSNTLDTIWSEVGKKHFNVAVTRTKDYLAWRLGSRPTGGVKGKYSLLLDVGGRGYLVFKVFNGEVETKCHIMCMLASDSVVAGNLIDAARAAAKAGSCSVLTTWLSNDHPYLPSFLDVGFVAESDVVWGYRIFDSGVSIDQCHIRMLDSDVF